MPRNYESDTTRKNASSSYSSMGTVQQVQKRVINRGKICSVLGCTRKARCKGFCTKHYEKFKKMEYARKKETT